MPSSKITPDQILEPKFTPGTRVADRPKPRGQVFTTEKGRQICAQFSNQRYGVVLDTIVKFHKVKKGTKEFKRRRLYVNVLWDGFKSSSLHDQNRLCHADELQEICNKSSYGIDTTHKSWD